MEQIGMRVRMLVAQTWQCAGAQRPLSVGTDHLVPPDVGRWLVQRGYAVALPVMETKPVLPQETKRGANGRELATQRRA